MCPPGGAKLYTREMFGEFAQSAKMPNIFLRRSSNLQEGRAPPLRVMRVFCNRSIFCAWSQRERGKILRLALLGSLRMTCWGAGRGRDGHGAGGGWKILRLARGAKPGTSHASRASGCSRSHDMWGAGCGRDGHGAGERLEDPSARALGKARNVARFQRVGMLAKP